MGGLRRLGRGLGAVNSSVRMLGRRVDGEKLERAAAAVEHIVPGAGRYKGRASGAKLLAVFEGFPAAARAQSGASLLNVQKLVDVPMLLRADRFSYGDAHNGHLQMLPRPDGRAERPVQQSRFSKVDGRGVGAAVHKGSRWMVTHTDPSFQKMIQADSRIPQSHTAQL